MVERPNYDGAGVPRPPAVYYAAGAAGLLALAGSVPVTVMVRDFTVVQRFVFGGPLLLLGLACWVFALTRFVRYADAVRRAREAQLTADQDREAEDLELIEAASRLADSPIQLPGAPAATAVERRPRRRMIRRDLAATRAS